jgi:hypothetical protein
VLAALDAARSITKSRTVNALGFCVGGTLLACALALLAARREETVASATFLTTMLDFTDPGEIGVYISPESVAAREALLLAGQRVQGSELAGAFASLRANDLVWNYVVNNYLKGRTPPPFDLLYWNGDSANLPGPMYAYYLKNMYVDNRLREHGALTMLGEPIDLARLRVRVTRRPHRPVAQRVPDPCSARRHVDVRARRVRTHRGCRQSTRRRQAQLLDQRREARTRRRLALRRRQSRRQLVAALVPVARRPCGRAPRRAGSLRQQRIPAARAGAGALRRRGGRVNRYSPGILTTLISIAAK